MATGSMEYLVICSSFHLSNFGDAVNTAIACGYKPLGGIAIAPVENDFDGLTYCQVMVKRKGWIARLSRWVDRVKQMEEFIINEQQHP